MRLALDIRADGLTMSIECYVEVPGVVRRTLQVFRQRRRHAAFILDHLPLAGHFPATQPYSDLAAAAQISPPRSSVQADDREFVPSAQIIHRRGVLLPDFRPVTVMSKMLLLNMTCRGERNTKEINPFPNRLKKRRSPNYLSSFREIRPC